MFLTFEGIEGSGKSTVINRLDGTLRAAGLPVATTREPGGTVFGRHLRTLLLDTRESFSPQAELLLFLADRAQHVREVILPALAEGSLILCDRFTDSTLAYQGYGRGIPLETLARLNEFATGGLTPDLTVLLDVPPELGLARAEDRLRTDGTRLSEGRFEDEHLDFHRRVREGYLRLAEQHPHRYMLVDASAPTDAVVREVENLAHAKIALLHAGS